MTCLYSKCDKEFVPKNSKTRFCCASHRVMWHRENRSGGLNAAIKSDGPVSSVPGSVTKADINELADQIKESKELKFKAPSGKKKAERLFNKVKFAPVTGKAMDGEKVSPLILDEMGQMAYTPDRVQEEMNKTGNVNPEMEGWINNAAKIMDEPARPLGSELIVRYVPPMPVREDFNHSVDFGAAKREWLLLYGPK